jgi:hypothetical protein
MEAEPAEGQSTNTGGDEAYLGLHQMSAIRESSQSCLDSFDKRNLFYRQYLFDDLL